MAFLQHTHKILAYRSSELESLPEDFKLAQRYKGNRSDQDFASLLKVMRTFGLSQEAIVYQFEVWEQQPKIILHANGGRLGTMANGLFPGSNAPFVHNVGGWSFLMNNERQTPEGLYPLDRDSSVISRFLHIENPLQLRYGLSSVSPNKGIQRRYDEGFNRIFYPETYGPKVTSDKLLRLDELMEQTVVELKRSKRAQTFMDNPIPVADLGNCKLSFHVFNTGMNGTFDNVVDAIAFPLDSHGVKVRTPFGFISTLPNPGAPKEEEFDPYKLTFDHVLGLPKRSNFSFAPSSSETPSAVLMLWYTAGNLNFEPPEVIKGCKQPTSSMRVLAQSLSHDIPGTVRPAARQKGDGTVEAFDKVPSSFGIYGLNWDGPLNVPHSMRLNHIPNASLKGAHFEPANWEIVSQLLAAVMAPNSTVGVYNLLETQHGVRVANDLSRYLSDKKVDADELRKINQEILQSHGQLPPFAQKAVTNFLKSHIVHPYNHDNIDEFGWVRPQKSGGWGKRVENQIHIHPREAGHGHVMKHLERTQSVYKCVQEWLSNNTSITNETDAADSLEKHLRVTFK